MQDQTLTWVVEIPLHGLRAATLVAFGDFAQAWKHYLQSVRTTPSRVCLRVRFSTCRPSHLVLDSLGNGLQGFHRIHEPKGTYKTSTLDLSAAKIKWIRDAWTGYYYKETSQKEEKMTTPQNKLYEIALSEDSGDKPAYGHKLAVNSAGQWVMELKGTGEVIAVSKDMVKEILPYTVAVKFSTSPGVNTYHYFDEKRVLKAGDFFILESGVSSGICIAQCTAVNTESKTAHREIQVLKIL